MSLFEPECELDWGSSRAEGLVFCHNGRHPGTDYYHDSSLFGHHGTLTNMDPTTDWVPTEKGWALDFDGVNDLVVLPSKAEVTRWTYIALIKLAALPASPERVAIYGHANGDTAANSWSSVLGIDANNKIEMYWYGNQELHITGATSLATGRWYVIAGTVDTVVDAYAVFLDGVDDTASSPGAVDGPSANITGRRIAFTTGNYAGHDFEDRFTGQIGLVADYNRALAPSEIQEDYAEYRPRPLVFPAAAAPSGYTVPLQLILECAQ